jgi:hypothetical protein
MKIFYPTYLYVKTHNKTGLKYFGKTTNDPFCYRGSGKHWLAHIKKHGYDVSTEIIGHYTEVDECIANALQFSKDNQIVETAEWANMIEENGIDGGDTGRTNYAPMSDDTKRKLSESKKGQVPWNSGVQGVTLGNTTYRTEEQKQKISKSLKGRKRDPEAVKKTADKLRGRKRPDVSSSLRGKKKSPETIEKMKVSQQRKGPLKEETKVKIREARKLQVITEETKEKLKGKVVCVNNEGQISRIDKDLYYSQTGLKENWEWVAHRSKEARMRRG